MTIFSIARLVAAATAANTINIPTVDIFLQKSPNKPGGDKRGITGLDFEVQKNGAVIQTGTTGVDGKIVMRVPGGSATLRVTASGGTADYDVSIRNAAIEAVTTEFGQQRRLRMLGYQLGHVGPDGNGVDGAAAPSREMDRSLQEFQADTPAINVGPAYNLTSLADARTQNALTAAAGA